MFRLSESEIFGREKQPRDWLSKIDTQIADLEVRIERAEVRYNTKRQLVVEQERRATERETFRKIKRLVPHFSASRFNTRDLKVIGHPIKFISFDGKDEGRVKKIRLIDFHADSKPQEKLHQSLERTLKSGNIEWQTLRITDDGNVEYE